MEEKQHTHTHTHSNILRLFQFPRWISLTPYVYLRTWALRRVDSLYRHIVHEPLLATRIAKSRQRHHLCQPWPCVFSSPNIAQQMTTLNVGERWRQKTVLFYLTKPCRGQQSCLPFWVTAATQMSHWLPLKRGKKTQTLKQLTHCRYPSQADTLYLYHIFSGKIILNSYLLPNYFVSWRQKPSTERYKYIFLLRHLILIPDTQKLWEVTRIRVTRCGRVSQ